MGPCLLLLSLTVLLMLTDLTKGDDFLISVVMDSSVSGAGVDFVTGANGGWVQAPFLPRTNLPSYHYEAHIFRDSQRTTTGVEQKSIRVSVSDDSVRVHGWYGFGKFTPIPVSALNTKYIVSSCLPSGINYSVVLVIASYLYGTDVNITFRLQGSVTYDGRAYSDGDTLTLSLKEDQTFTIRSDFDLTGTVVNTSQSVAVFSGTMRNNMVIAYDQLLPVHHHGQEYVVAIDDNSDLYKLQIVSEHKDTVIRFTGGPTRPVGTSGQYRETLRQNVTLHFYSSRPVMTTLCRIVPGDIRTAFVVVPPVSLYVKHTNIYTYKYEGYNYKVITYQSSRDLVIRNNSTRSRQRVWMDILGSRYTVATMTPPKYDIVSITSSTSFTVLAFNVFLSFNGGYNFAKQQAVCDSEHYGRDCTGVCVARHCEGFSPCNASTGLCVRGCQTGWTGTDCTETVASSLNVEIIAGVTAAGVGVILVCVLVGIIICRKKSDEHKGVSSPNVPKRRDESSPVIKYTPSAGGCAYIAPIDDNADNGYSSTDYLELLPDTESGNAIPRDARMSDAYEPVRTYEGFTGRDSEAEYTRLQSPQLYLNVRNGSQLL